MNINLLPKKFVRNRATDIILLVFSIGIFVLILLNTGIILLLNLQSSRLSIDVQASKMEQINLEKQISTLEKAQSIDIQEFLVDFRDDKKLASPIMASFEKIARDLDLDILTYQVSLFQNTDEQRQAVFAQNGEELLLPVIIRLQGDIFDGVSKFKSEIEKIEWVYDTHPLSVTRDGEEAISEFQVRIKKVLPSAEVGDSQ